MYTDNIPFQKYINILSGVLAGRSVSTRELMGRFFTTDQRLPPKTYIELHSPTSVGKYFGTDSTEYKKAVFYFSFISKNYTTPQSISYFRWVDSAVAPLIFGQKLTLSLTSLALISDGSFRLKIGETSFAINGLNFTSASSLSDIASTMQISIRAAGSASGVQWTASTVSYNNISGGFDFVGGSAVDAIISVAAGSTGTDVSQKIGWRPQAVGAGPGAIWCNGSIVETITQTLINSDSISDNFGSFTFIPLLTLEQHIEAAAWNLPQNVKYMYKVGCTLENYVEWKTALLPYGGTGIDLISSAGVGLNYVWQDDSHWASQANNHMVTEQTVLTDNILDMTPVLSMAILASTNYNARKSVQNYYSQYSQLLSPLVFTREVSDALDAAFVNYIGKTHQNQAFSFYQRGYLMGFGGDLPILMGAYANEQWLKSAMGAALMTLTLDLPDIPGDAEGKSYITTIIQSVIDLALFNGTINVGSILDVVKKTLIGNITGNDKAWMQVKDQGYWYSVQIVDITNPDNGSVEKQAKYILIYAKDNSVLSIEGKHELA
jgi:hypothetical protein